MSQNQQWVPPTRAPVGGGGSVRRARERMEAGLPPEMPTAPQQKPFDSSRDGASTSQRARPPMPQALQGQGPIGVAISRPTQVPQWPLAGTIETSSDDGKAKYQPPAGRGPAPPRPARPSRVPSILDASRLQEHTPTFQYKAPQPRYQDEDEDLMSPSSRSQLTSSSRPSTLSSVGTIPDFPIPNIPPPSGPPRRSANLGPPPSSRRGASSYYSQASFVSPIPEENTPTRSHGSYASSAAIPSTWGSESNYEDEDVDDMESPISDTRGDIDVIEEGRESRESNDDNEERGLVRKASIGKRVQPSMITTTSSERVSTVVGLPARPGPKPGSKLERMGVLPLASPNPATAAAAGAALGAVAARSDVERPGTQWPIPGDMDSPLASGTGFIDKSTSSSERSIPTLATAVTTDIRQPAPTYNPTSPQAQEMLAAYNGASSLAPPGGVSPGGVSPARTPSPGYSRLSAIRRPPRLDIDAVRDAEARGSLTSLPDLIRRATRLAAMMDRGRRPASRINDLNDFPFAGDEKQRSGDRGDLDYSASDEKHRSGLSGMLAAFPPPGVATPVREQSPRPVSPWPSPYQDSQGALNETDGQQKKKRKCCGLPCWGFLLVLLIILVIIAAAIVVPLELLVFNKPKAGSNTSTTSSTLSSCQNQLKCQNGGSNIVSNGVCSCLCVNGFTGSTCTIAGANGCATTSVPSTDTTGSVTNVTIGDAISRIIDGAQTNFSVPLFASIIVARFNTANLSCISENSLITFDGLDSRTGNSADKVVPTTTAAAAKREETAVVSAAAEAIQSVPSGQTISLFPTTSTVTSIFGSPTASTTFSTKGTSTTAATTSQKTTLATTGTVSSTSTTSSTSAAATASTTGSFTVTEQVLDFSRVAVLFVLQQETLDSAITAQSAIQKFFDANTQTSSAAGNLSIGNSNTINLVNLSIDLGNGTVGQNNVATSTRKRGVMFGQGGVELYPSL